MLAGEEELKDSKLFSASSIYPAKNLVPVYQVLYFMEIKEKFALYHNALLTGRQQQKGAPQSFILRRSLDWKTSLCTVSRAGLCHNSMPQTTAPPEACTRHGGPRTDSPGG